MTIKNYLTSNFKFNFSDEKSQLLKSMRGVCFEDVIEAFENNQFLVDINHYSKKYSDQRILVVRINNYAYAVPYVINQEKKEVFLKTIFASRILTLKYIQGGKK